MNVYQILHIPTGEFLVSTNRRGQSVLFADEKSAEQMIACIVTGKRYIQGAPVRDFAIGNQDSVYVSCAEEFTYVSTHVDFQYPGPRVLSFS